MLQVSTEVEKVRFCLDTLAFLVLDKANRKTVASLNGADAILRVMLRLDDTTVRRSAVEALLSLVKHDDADKVGVIFAEAPCQPRVMPRKNLGALFGLTKGWRQVAAGASLVAPLSQNMIYGCSAACLLADRTDNMILVLKLL